jgi:glutamyl-tRNA reductase
MEYLIVSFTHKNTNIQTREKLAFSNDLEKELFLKDILQSDAINEAILVSTCNRVEFILSVSCTHGSQKVVLRNLASRSNIDLQELETLADTYKNEDAIHHLFTVVSSLDSLVVGETQIAGQVKDAFRFAISKEFASSKLSRIVNYAFKCAAKVRRATSLGTGSVSVASTAVAKAKDLYKDIDGVSAVVIGAGEMSEIAIKHLLKANFSVIICSRNIQKAKVLANSLENNNVSVEPYSKLKELLNTKRLLITATSAPYPIITKDLVEDFNQHRNWFDIAVPRDIEDMDIDGIDIYSVDDLQGIVDENITLRNDAAIIAYRIVKDTTNEFFEWIKTLSVEPTIKRLHTLADEIIEDKLKKAIKKSYVNAQDEQNIKKLCQTIMNEFLHKPSKNIRDLSTTIECDNTLNVAQKIFSITDETQ